jgi:uncharacterized membrane protein
VVLAVAGIAVAGYLLWARETGSALVCPTGGCETLQDSAYAELFGIPVALLGVVGYMLLLVTALARGEAARSLQTVVALAAAVFGGYLLYVQIEVIGAVCQWCLASDAIITGITMLALLRLKVAQESPAPPSSRPSASA